MNPAPKASAVCGEKPGILVFTEDGALKSRPAGSCPHCGPWEGPSCVCRELRKRCVLFNQAMIPALYGEATLPEIDNDIESSASLHRAATWVLAWARSEGLPNQGILLAGANGVGKTFLMAALARSLTLERGLECRFEDFRNLLLRLKATFNGHGSEREVFESLLQPPILILDDVGSHRDSAWSRDVMKTIIALRYNACGKTFITTNLGITANKGSLSAFEQWAGSHCVSRLSEMCFWLTVDGPDRRRRHRLRHTQPCPTATDQKITPSRQPANLYP